MKMVVDMQGTPDARDFGKVLHTPFQPVLTPFQRLSNATLKHHSHSV